MKASGQSRLHGALKSQVQGFCLVKRGASLICPRCVMGTNAVLTTVFEKRQAGATVKSGQIDAASG